MVREKRGKETAPSSPVDSSTTPELETDSDGGIREVASRGKRAKKQTIPKRARGRGKPLPQDRAPQSSSRARARVKRANVDASGDDYNDNIDLSFLERMVIRMEHPVRGDGDEETMDFKKGRCNMKALRYGEDPRNYSKQFKGDPRFWFPHQADWYSSVIMTKDSPTTEMKFIDWNYLKTLPIPVIDEVIEACESNNLTNIMSFSCDWNEEVVAQFYATLFVDDSRKIMHWTLNGKRFSVSRSDFSHLLGFNPFAPPKTDLHRGSELEVTKMAFMYHGAYGVVKFGKTSGLKPYYKLLNQLFRYTLTPRGGDSDNISGRARNLLYSMAPGKGDFAVFDFIWNEIILCSYSPKSGCHYAPYIFHMIKRVTGLEILTDKVHLPYKPPKGKLEQLLKIGKHSSGVEPTQASGPGASSSHDPATSHGPSSSHGPPRGKKSTLASIAQGLFACFNVCRHTANELREHQKHVDEQMLKFETRQKALMAKNDMPHSPLREPRDFPPPPIFYNPWEDEGQFSQAHDFGGGEHDFGGGEVPSAHEHNDDEDTPAGSYEEEEGSGEDDDGNGEDDEEDDDE